MLLYINKFDANVDQFAHSQVFQTIDEFIKEMRGGTSEETTEFSEFKVAEARQEETTALENAAHASSAATKAEYEKAEAERKLRIAEENLRKAEYELRKAEYDLQAKQQAVQKAQEQQQQVQAYLTTYTEFPLSAKVGSGINSQPDENVIVVPPLQTSLFQRDQSKPAGLKELPKKAYTTLKK